MSSKLVLCLLSDLCHNRKCLVFFFLQAFLADDSPGSVDSTHRCQVLLHQEDSKHTRPEQQVIYSLYMSMVWLLSFNTLTYPHPSCRVNLFLLTYLLFPVNVLIGVLLALWRMIITALFNIVHMGRMDISLLNRTVEAFDPGEPLVTV